MTVPRSSTAWITRLDGIVAYTYRADLYCPWCVLDVLGENEDYEPYVQGESSIPTEVVLDRVARAIGLDREDERSFDSDVFPKIVFRDQLDLDEDGKARQCGRCGEVLS